jgi:hypothetical protein
MTDLERRAEVEEDGRDVGGYYAWTEADRVGGKRRDAEDEFAAQEGRIEMALR